MSFFDALANNLSVLKPSVTDPTRSPNDPNALNAGCDKVNRLFGANSLVGDPFLNAAGKVGSQALYNYATQSLPKATVDAKTNAGVRALVDAVNTGTRSFAGSTVNQASRAVMGSAGIDPRVVPTDPNGKTIFNNAQVAADTLGTSLIAGVVDEADLPGPISALSAAAFLQQQAMDEPIDISDPGCGISAYARDLIQYAPKHNFMFMVKFVFQSDYENLGVQEHAKNQKSEEIKFHYLCKSFTRPSVNIDYEDVNMYNFHTKVAKRVTYDPVNVKLYDDIQNSSMVFLEKYLKIRSPVARHNSNVGNLYELYGMDYGGVEAAEDGQAALPGSSASMGGLINENRSVLKQVEVYHIFAYGRRVNKYTYINPKIMQFNISDFDMEDTGEAASIDIQMAYDSMHIETDIPVSTPDLRDRSKLGERFVRKYSKG